MAGVEMHPAGKATRRRRGIPERADKTGFASQPAEFIQPDLDLNDLIAPSRMTTFFFEAVGPSPDPTAGVDLYAGDQVVVDRARPMRNGSLVLADDGENFVVRRLRIEGKRAWLVADDANLPDIEIVDERCLVGTVTCVVHFVPNP